MHMGLGEQNNAQEKIVHQFIHDIEQFDRLQLPVFIGVTIQQSAGIYYFVIVFNNYQNIRQITDAYLIQLVLLIRDACSNTAAT
jgi:hypothetical protein